jgi:mannosyltransferase OCH1-like enzyme
MATPKILYQTWKTKVLPEKFQSNVQKWKYMLPRGEWKYLLLDDEDLRNLVKDNFPKYLEAYDGFTQNIERVDFARYVMMYLGGVYADLDTYPLKPIDKFVNMNQIVLGREPLEHAHSIYNREVVLCNAFMISPPKEQFWIDLMDYIVENYEPYYKAVDNTGPMAMTKFYEKHPEKFANVSIQDPCVFFPLTGKGKVTQGCDMEKDTYVVHEWTNTWVPTMWTDQMWYNKRYWSYAAILLLSLWLLICIINRRK